MRSGATCCRDEWDAVLPQLARCVYLRMCSRTCTNRDAGDVRTRGTGHGEGDLRQSHVMRAVKSDQSRRYGRLEHYVSARQFPAEDAYGGTTKEKRREKLAEALLQEVTVVPPSRLWLSSVRRSNGRRARDRYRRAFDLFSGQGAGGGERGRAVSVDVSQED